MIEYDAARLKMDGIYLDYLKSHFVQIPLIIGKVVVWDVVVAFML